MRWNTIVRLAAARRPSRWRRWTAGWAWPGRPDAERSPADRRRQDGADESRGGAHGSALLLGGCEARSHGRNLGRGGPATSRYARNVWLDTQLGDDTATLKAPGGGSRTPTGRRAGSYSCTASPRPDDGRGDGQGQQHGRHEGADCGVGPVETVVRGLRRRAGRRPAVRSGWSETTAAAIGLAGAKFNWWPEHEARPVENHGAAPEREARLAATVGGREAERIRSVTTVRPAAHRLGGGGRHRPSGRRPRERYGTVERWCAWECSFLVDVRRSHGHNLGHPAGRRDLRDTHAMYDPDTQAEGAWRCPTGRSRAHSATTRPAEC